LTFSVKYVTVRHNKKGNIMFIVRCADTHRMVWGLLQEIKTEAEAILRGQQFVDCGFIQRFVIERIEND